MTNEELARRIHEGETGLCGALYQQNKGLLAMYCCSYYNRYPERYAHCGVELCDMENECYFALLEAVEIYHSKPGYKFTTCLRYPLVNRLRTLAGFRLKTKGRDPLNNCESLDKPVDGDSEELYLRDTIPDEGAEFADGVLHSVACSGVFPAVLRALQDVPAYGDILLMRYRDNMTLETIAAAYGCTGENIRQNIYKAMRTLRHPQNGELRELYEDIIGATYHMGGLNRFKNTNTSSTEWAALKVLHVEEF